LNDPNNALTSGDLMFQFTQAANGLGGITDSADIANAVTNGSLIALS